LNLASNGAGTSGLATLAVDDAVINVSATGFNMAQGSASPDPVVIANQRVGGSESQTLTVANTAPAGAFTEGLSASFDASTGDAVNNSGSISLLAGGASDNSALSVGVDTSAAGTRTGTITINYQTDGTGTSGLAAESVGSQAITVSGNVYQVAAGNLNTTSLNFGVVQVGQTVTQNLSISNIATGLSGFVEDLNAQFGTASGTGSNLIIGNGAISGLLAGATDSSSMVVSVNTASAGTIDGAIAVNYFSAGTVGGVGNGLDVLAVGSQNFGVIGTIDATGTVVDQAVPVINTAQPIVLGNVREGAASPTALVSVTNQATGNLQAALNAEITGNASITASGSFNLLLPGDTNADSLQVGMNTATAGAINGTATLAFVSDAGNHGGGQLTLPSQDVQVQGAVYRLAEGTADPDPVAFGNVRINTTAEQVLTITNTAAADGFSEVLNAVFGTASGAATDNASSVNLLAAGSSDATSMTAGLDTSVAGERSGAVTVNFASDGTGTTGEAAIGVGGQTIEVTGTVYRLANPEVDTAQPVILAARVGDDVPTQNLSVTNQSLDAFTEGLKADIGTVDAGFTGSGNIANLAAGGTDGTSLSVGLADTSVSQNLSGNVNLNFQSTGAGTTGADDISVGSEAVQVQGRVYQQAVAQVDATTVNFGIVHVGDDLTAQLGISNAANAAVLNDLLQGGWFSDEFGVFSTPGDLGAGLGAGATTNLGIGLDTSAAGVYNETGQLVFRSVNPDLADLSLGFIDIILSAQVNNFANPWFTLDSGLGSLSASGLNFLFDYGTLFDDFGAVSTGFSFSNAVAGPADLLRGSYDLTGVSAQFTLGGFASFDNLVAGAAIPGLSFAFNTAGLGLGSFQERIALTAFGFNASGFEERFDISLTFQGTIRDTAAVDEPPVLLLMLFGLAGLYGLRRRAS
jgi:hypothetical protein